MKRMIGICVLVAGCVRFGGVNESAVRDDPTPAVAPDVEYEDFEGHKLDRKMLDLLISHL